MSRCHVRACDDRGSGLISSSIAVLVVLLFVAWSAHLLLAMEATSTVMAVSTDAARDVAARDVDHGDPGEVHRAERRAEAAARADLGALGREVSYDWTVTAEEVRLRVRFNRPWRLGPGWSPVAAFARLDRTVVTRIERAR